MKNVTMYTLNICPRCEKTKKYFKDHNIPFDYIDYDLADAKQQEKILVEMGENNANGFQFVR